MESYRSLTLFTNEEPKAQSVSSPDSVNLKERGVVLEPRSAGAHPTPTLFCYTTRLQTQHMQETRTALSSHSEAPTSWIPFVTHCD